MHPIFTLHHVMCWAGRNGWPSTINLSPDKWIRVLDVLTSSHPSAVMVEKGSITFGGMEFVWCADASMMIPELEDMQ